MSTGHPYQACGDDRCERKLCEVWKEARREGYEDGYEDGWAAKPPEQIPVPVSSS